jgi:ribosomal protein S18 acetylase RimI-like enzyme
MKIRRAKIKDTEELIKVIQLADGRTEEIARRKVKKYSEKKDGFFLIVLENEKLIGYALFDLYNEEIEANKYVDIREHASVCWIAVLQEFRMKKIGSRLLKEAERYTKKFGKKGVWLGCREGVIGFYEKNEYKNKGNYLRKTSSGIMKPYYIMVKELK